MMRRKLIVVGCYALLATTSFGSVPMTPAGNGHLVVPTFVNGKGTVPFILDTGADSTGVYSWFARQQGLPLATPGTVVGMTGSTEAPFYRLDSLSVDGRTIRNLEVAGYPDRKDAAITAGVTGNDLMDGSVAIFDFPCRLVSLLPKPVQMNRLLTRHARMVVAGTVKQGTQLTFPVTIGKTVGVAILDTGSRDTRINTRFAKAAGIDPTSASFRDGETIFGANSNGVVSRRGPAGTLRFAGLEVRDAQVRVVDLSVYDSWEIADRPAMIFGQDVMQDYRLVYDYSAKRFWFDRSTCPSGNKT